MTSDSIDNRLRIVHRILVISRSLALNGVDTRQLAGVLDETEYLIALIRFGEEEPGEFRDHLCNLSARFPEFACIAQEFDDSTNPVETVEKCAEAA